METPKDTYSQPAGPDGLALATSQQDENPPVTETSETAAEHWLKMLAIVILPVRLGRKLGIEYPPLT